MYHINLNKIGLLTTFAKINKRGGRGGLNQVRGGRKKI